MQLMVSKADRLRHLFPHIVNPTRIANMGSQEVVAFMFRSVIVQERCSLTVLVNDTFWSDCLAFVPKNTWDGDHDGKYQQ